MTILKNKLFLLIVIIGAVLSAVYFGGFWRWTSDVQQPSDARPSSGAAINSPEPSADSTGSPQATDNLSPMPTPRPIASSVPLPTGDGRTSFTDEPVPWSLLLGQASCRLQGEIKFLNHNTYDNQDAKFIYSGVDHPARNIFWTVIPQDDLSVGPNIFGRLVLPNGENLLSITLPENPKYEQYELTAKMQYGRLVDDKGNFVTVGGNVKVFEKQCDGKITVVLP
ncbi:MAG: hypothetical protein A2655_02135 [Candidatus Yanofskybacteria bacterium RIFCSPHIGHO2_01_FULL_43_42]|uniref:Uncharacterized protein n=1 Tax=Candidatus Yanofskybacteria bacterium RIFCSPLOWO2_01_FULL_43_22 TaxID=1802695 RepID=A0A1F8GH15_9BACT|nr:MAG: hypothetical protein A2655_02135 [Candidatus Yanofskybacteria bacterium RIFCSPHIGHO2_01_FULL_43_42]OGN13268.1 MAG: hypothetical protein A3D48_03040 [Candidatus Yanofskybacteria bacterium RIFCSPHIGHO2_02_FULL_43_17]OGN24684.1 MAG: hypothetical protein A3A13_01265 [Candidatus Yanofskybacteria bacterium RIFCSPLOWO2_01_FULL_43_22]